MQRCRCIWKQLDVVNPLADDTERGPAGEKGAQDLLDPLLRVPCPCTGRYIPSQSRVANKRPGCLLKEKRQPGASWTQCKSWWLKHEDGVSPGMQLYKAQAGRDLEPRTNTAGRAGRAGRADWTGKTLELPNRRRRRGRGLVLGAPLSGQRPPAKNMSLFQMAFDKR